MPTKTSIPLGILCPPRNFPSPRIQFTVQVPLYTSPEHSTTPTNLPLMSPLPTTGWMPPLPHTLTDLGNGVILLSAFVVD